MNRIYTYGFSGILVRSLDSSRRGLFAICSFALPESIIHQTVSQPNGIFGLCENHRDYLYPFCNTFGFCSINSNKKQKHYKKVSIIRGVENE